MDNTNVVLKNVRLSFVHILKPYANDPSQEAKYSTTVLVQKNDAANIAAINTAIAAAIEAGRNSKWNGIVPPQVPNPIHDGDGVKQDGTAFGPECKGCLVFTASTSKEYPVDVVDRSCQPIMDATQIYSGIYANISINFRPYLYQSKKGVGAYLGPVQKVSDGDPLSAMAPKAKDVFAPVAGAPAGVVPVQQVAYQTPYQAPAGLPGMIAIDPVTGLPR